MMTFSALSPWYFVAALLLAGAATALFAIIDRRTMRQMLKTTGILTAELGGFALLVVSMARLNSYLAIALMVVIIGCAHLLKTTRSGMTTYHRSRQNTLEHYEYLLGNGATRLEALMPSVRRALRAAILSTLHNWSSKLTSAPLLLLLGMLLAGAEPLAAAVATLLLSLSFIGLSVLTVVAGIWITEKRTTK